MLIKISNKLTLTSNMLRRKLHLPPVVEQSFKKPRSEELFESNNCCISDQFLSLARQLNESLNGLVFKDPVKYVYNPTEYAYEPYATYVTKYCNGPKKLLFVGMNPGPFGMCQTGVPFGEINHVRNWLEIDGTVTKPPNECPYRQVLGFNCNRSEESGKRLWGFFKKTCETPDNFFRNAFVYNYCPLAFLKNDGGNLTPPDIKNQIETLKQLESYCNDMLLEVIKLLEVEILIGVGKYAEGHCKQVLKENNLLGTQILYMPHPSPRAPGNWFDKNDKFMKQNNLFEYFK